METFKLNGASFVGTATNEAIRADHMVLANATTTVTAKFYPVPVALENIGTGNGVLTTFTVSSPAVEALSETVYVNSVLQVRGTNYTIVNSTGVITFTVAPANGLAVTAQYRGTISKVQPMIAGQYLKIEGPVTTVTSTASITLS